ncbi:Oligoribonuclease, related [Neospora caninum Liverpool]|uniref:Oligoribonuclease, related n=1 Tax=Neospora caninum (strain Liverpool) TaxID=572307 RepID=F0VMP5_NEOCL|nr:Oligoribonuclease, related [Neospora caninum Liverpool]CBZ54991.1 Oligoribonuclease, related [Neospora caninum Liverpool]CEL69714.1 TPA: Oligoribonuclease, related [Neospora caninum Liverpool]|eukprot:XP_003885019.1 Oligoribonuclease, related [Neospora caninum Liverpool]
MRLFPRFPYKLLSKTRWLTNTVCLGDNWSSCAQPCFEDELARLRSSKLGTTGSLQEAKRPQTHIGGEGFTGTRDEKAVVYRGATLKNTSSGGKSAETGFSFLPRVHFHSLSVPQPASEKMEHPGADGAMQAPVRFQSVSKEEADHLAPIRTSVTISEENGTELQAPIVWIDCEMTGLDVERDQIIEIAVIVTDGQCRRRIVGPHLIIHASDKLLDGMDEWCKKTHGNSGLTAACRQSTTTLADAEEKILDFVSRHVATTRVAPLGGNSVHVDRQFLTKQMPRLIAHLSYRIIDVSTVKELAKRWKPELPFFEKANNHRALDDIHASIDELLYYSQHLFRIGQ